MERSVMAPVSEVKREGDSSRSLSREDCLCPICLEIFMEPVTLPCSHTFCKLCFLESVDKATLCCPLCRKRVAVWVRHHSRNKTLVNETLWAKIQAGFPRQKLQDDHYEPVVFPRLSEPGAVRREYEDEVTKLTQEKQEFEEQERKASEEFIQRLLAEDEQLLRERQQRHEEDERLARLLSQELNSVPEQSQSSKAPAPKKKNPVGMDRFLFPVSRSSAHMFPSNKENVLVASDLPPPLDYYGPHISQSQPRESHISQSQPRESHISQSQPQESHISQSQPRESKEFQTEDMDQWQLMNRSEESRTKRKGPTEEKAESKGKRSCHSSCLLGVAIGDWEAEPQLRRKQEEDDLRVALELQRQLDRQQHNTDRRKGTADAYPLRTTARGPRTDPKNKSKSATDTGIKASSKTATPSSTVTLSSMQKQATPPNRRLPSALATPPNSRRQTTLTDLFSVHSKP